MMYFNPELIEKATEILNSVKELAEAKKDLDLVNNIINNFSSYNLTYIRTVNNVLRAKYWEINVLCRLGNSIKWIKSDSIFINNTENYELELLKQDRFGILAHALYETHNIVNLAEFFDTNYIEQ